MVNEHILNNLKEKLKGKHNDEKKYDSERKKLTKSIANIFFDELPSMFNNDTYYTGDELEKLGFHEKGGITLWIDTTKENREKQEDDILECITYENYGDKGRLSYHNNDELKLFVDNIDIVLEKLSKTL